MALATRHEPTIAVIYCRISKDDGRALGVARQEADCRAWCERRGWTVGEVIVDNDTSAYSAKRRPGYERLIAGIESGEYRALVVWHPDRLHRSPRELEDFIVLVERAGTEIGTVTAGDWDLSTPDGRLTARIVGSVARKESEDKSRRLRRKHLELAEAGMPSGGGRRPFGFETDKVTHMPSEAAEVRSMVARFLAGESLYGLAADLRGRGVASSSGGRWTSTTVRTLIASSRIAGQRDHRGRSVDAVWDGIVSPEDVLRVRARLAGNGVRASVPRVNLLVGLAACGECGRTLSTTTMRPAGRAPFRRYVCTGERGCGRCGVGAHLLDGLVERALLSRLVHGTVPRVPSVDAAPDPLADLADCDRLDVMFAEMLASNEMNRQQWRDAVGRLAERRAIANALAAATLADVAVRALMDRGAEVGERWPSMTLHERRAVVDQMVERIVVRAGSRHVHGFDPSRVTIEWRGATR